MTASKNEGIFANALHSDGTAIQEPVPQQADIASGDDLPVKEIIEKRSEYGKVFRLGPNRYQAVTYAQAAHYKQAGDTAWREADRRFTQSQAGVLSNSGGSLRVQCGYSGETPFICVERANGSKLSYGVAGAARIQPAAEHEEIDENDCRLIACRERAAKKASGTVYYPGIFAGTVLRCHAQGDSLKEEVIFAHPAAVKAITFVLDASNMQLKAQENGDIHIADAQGEMQFVLPKPFLTDKAGAEGNAEVTVSGKNGLYSITCTPDASFLEQALFPVTLDSTIYTQKNTNAIDDTYVDGKSSYASTNFSTQAVIKVYHSSTRDKYIYMRAATLPEITSADFITKAQFCLAKYTQPEENPKVLIREVASAWNVSTVTYNTRPGVSALLQDYTTISSTSSYSVYCKFDVTALARKWYQGGQNYGIQFEAQGGWPNEVIFESSRGLRTPYFMVEYSSLAGLEDYLAYETHSIGRAGTAYVSLFNGNLIFAHADTACGGSRMPVSLTHYYNSCDASKNDLGMGRGWRTTMHQTLHRESIADAAGNATLYYVYTDSDGTRHYFKNTDGVYRDTSGLNLILTLGVNTASIADKGDNVMTFGLPTVDLTPTNASVALKLIQNIADACGNTVVIAGSGLQINTVTDGAGRVTAFAYANGLCASITPPYTAGMPNPPQVTFAYDAESRLIGITHPDNLTNQYSYQTGNHLLLSATDIDGRVLSVSYLNLSVIYGLPQYVSGVTVSKSGQYAANRGYTYENRLCVVQDRLVENGKRLTYHFNDNGNVTSVNDELGYAVFAGFSDTTLNKPQALSRMQRVVTNLLVDHSIENNDTAWVKGDNIGTGTFQRVEGVYVNGLVSRSIEISEGGESYCRQAAGIVPGNSYTLSSYIKTQNNVVAFLRVTYPDVNGQTQTIDSDPVQYQSDFERISVSFTLPSNMTGTSANCCLMCGQHAGKAWFDCVQLEDGLTCNQYNLLQNSNFAHSDGSWFMTQWLRDPTTESYYGISTDIPAWLSGRAVRLMGSYTRSITIFQDLRAYGSAGDDYVMGGWSRGYAKAPIAGQANPTYCLRVYFSYVNSSEDWTLGGTAQWNDEEGNWQFICGTAHAAYNYNAIRLMIAYNAQINYCDFTNLFLYRERYGKSFQYDGQGNCTAVTTAANLQSGQTYDSCNNLTAYRQPGRPANVQTVLTYGVSEAEKKKHLVNSSTSPMGTLRSFTYDSVGNALTDTVGNSGGTLFVKTQTAYQNNGNHVYTKTDSQGKTAILSVNPDTDLLGSVTDPNGQAVTYSYDALKRTTRVQAAVGPAATCMLYENQYVYTNDRLTALSHNTQTADGQGGVRTATDPVSYSFEYDVLGRQTVVKVGTQTLSANTYNADGTLQKVTYGNYGEARYTYDAFKRVIGMRQDADTADRYSYAYNAQGNIAYLTDNTLNRRVASEQDTIGRPRRVRTTENGANVYTAQVGYNDYSLLSALNERVGAARTEYNTTLAYDNENRPTSVQYGSAQNQAAYTYDALGRTDTRTVTLGGNAYAGAYGYRAGGQGAGSTSLQISSITQTGESFSYTYDDVGNIVSVTRGAYTATYAYDNLGQLIRANDPEDPAAGSGAQPGYMSTTAAAIF